jgi:hypothetical protein
MATDPRDKVFCLDRRYPDSIGLEPDYKLSTEEIYLLVETRNLEERKELELLAHGGVSSALENSSFYGGSKIGASVMTTNQLSLHQQKGQSFVFEILNRPYRSQQIRKS